MLHTDSSGGREQVAQVGLFFLSVVGQTGRLWSTLLRGCFIPWNSYFKYFCLNTINIVKTNFS